MKILKQKFFLILLALFWTPVNAIGSAEANTKVKKNHQQLDKEKNLLKADQIYYNKEKDYLEATGNVRIINGDGFLKTDHAYIDLKTKRIWMNHDVYAENPKHKIFATSLYLDEKEDKASFSDVKLKISESDFMIAKRLDKKDKDHFELYDAGFTPCTLCIKYKPLWQINAKKTQIDLAKDQISYRNATFSISGYKILYLPFFSHPIPGAKPRSGILKPQVYNGTLRVPIYYYIKPNMDLTYTPRFNNKVLINEGEFRHLINNGRYEIKGSVARLPIKKDSINPNKKTIDRFYADSFGNFTNNQIHYGYRFATVSDKLYLRNYYNDYNTTYMKSDLHIYKISDDGYISSDIEHYQGLRASDNSGNDPNVLPKITAKKDIEFDNGLEFSAKNSMIKYFEKENKDIYRDNLELSILKNFYGKYGQNINLSLNNYLDLYHITKSTETIGSRNLIVKNRELVRNTVEAQIRTKIPFFFSLNSDHSIILEPETNLAISPRKPSVDVNKYDLIDSNNVDLNENNIFEATRYSGSDYREYGTRFSYGLNNYLASDKWTISSFLGQLLKTNSDLGDSKSNYVGKISFSYEENFEIYYRFQRKIKSFEAERDEIVTYLNLGGLVNQTNITFLKDLRQYPNYRDNQNSIKQITSSISYALSNGLRLFGDIKLDFMNRRKPEVLSDSIGVSYRMDCIAFTAKITNNYTIGSKEKGSFSFSLGLKTINM